MKLLNLITTKSLSSSFIDPCEKSTTLEDEIFGISLASHVSQLQLIENVLFNRRKTKSEEFFRTNDVTLPSTNAAGAINYRRKRRKFRASLWLIKTPINHGAA